MDHILVLKVLFISSINPFVAYTINKKEDLPNGYTKGINEG